MRFYAPLPAVERIAASTWIKCVRGNRRGACITAHTAPSVALMRALHPSWKPYVLAALAAPPSSPHERDAPSRRLSTGGVNAGLSESRTWLMSFCPWC